METENNNVQVEPVPYIAHEAEMARIEREHDKERDQWNKEREQHKRTVRWLCSIIIVLVLALVGVFIYEAQYVDEVSETIETSTEGGGNAYGTIVSGDGSEVNYGTNGSDANENQGP